MQKKTKLDFTHLGKLKEITIVSQYTDIKEIKLEGFNFQKMYEEYMDRNNYKYDKNCFIQFGDYIREIVINGDFETKDEQEIYDEYDKILTEDYPMPSQSVDYTLFIADKEINI